eukprot:6483913-Amphidinium_carterae.1
MQRLQHTHTIVAHTKVRSQACLLLGCSPIASGSSYVDGTVPGGRQAHHTAHWTLTACVAVAISPAHHGRRSVSAVRYTTRCLTSVLRHVESVLSSSSCSSMSQELFTLNQESSY